jgi:hypothetical protein
MRRSVARVLLLSFLLGSVLVAQMKTATAAVPDDEQVIVQAEHSFVQAAGKADAKDLAGLLDADFTWIDPDGNISRREQVLQNAEMLSSAKDDANYLKTYNYGQVGGVFGVHGMVRFERIWVKRAEGWKLLRYHEVPIQGEASQPYSAASDSATPARCENPCTIIPYKPTTQADREVIAAFEAMNVAGSHSDADAWAKEIGDDDFGITPGVLVTKAGRISTIKKQKEANVFPAPAPLLVAQFFDFGDVVVMEAIHQPQSGKPHHFTRVWIRRNGEWKLVAGAETQIKAAPAAYTK